MLYCIMIADVAVCLMEAKKKRTLDLGAFVAALSFLSNTPICAPGCHLNSVLLAPAGLSTRALAVNTAI